MDVFIILQLSGSVRLPTNDCRVRKKRGKRHYCKKHKQIIYLKGALSGLKQCFPTESPLKMMKNAFLFYLKSSFHFQDI